jgi:23S rRNA pseudouridine1911/1915/1917 synthase
MPADNHPRQELVADREGWRLDRYLAEKLPDRSRASLQELIREGFVTVNGRPARPASPLKPGDRVTVELPPPAPTTATAEDIPLTVIYEDEDLAVIDKPAGLTTHPAPGHPAGTLLNALLSRFPELRDSGLDRPGIVHRLDKDTSGLMVVARSRQAHARLSDQFRNREVTKIYLALVRGCVEPAEGIIEAAIGRHRTQRKKMTVSEQGREARSRFKVIRRFRNHTLLEVRIYTGRTHQIRVHLAAIGHPVIGDATYGAESADFPRQFLHAHRLGFRHPADGREMSFTSELPADLAGPLERLT